MTKKIDEFKLLIILIIIFLILLGIYLICRLLKERKADIEASTNYNYTLIDSVNDFELYEVYGSSFNVNLNNVIIDYNNYSLSINGIPIKDNILLNNRVSFLGNNILFIITDLINNRNALLLFNRIERNTMIIDKIDGMYINDTNNIEIVEAGVKLYISNYINDVLNIDGKIYDLCKYKKNMVIFKELMYFYDYPSDMFTSMDIIDTKTIKDYKKYYCK